MRHKLMNLRALSVILPSILVLQAGVAISQEAVPQAAYPFEPPQPTKGSEETKAVRDEVLRDAASSMLDPGNISEIRRRKLDGQAAASYPGYAGADLPVAVPKEIRFSPEAGRGAESIRLAAHISTPITFVDKNGQPWPVQDVLYSPKRFSLNGNGCGEQNELNTSVRPSTIYITACEFWTWTSFSVQLEEVNVPVVFIAASGANGADPSRNYIDVPIVVRVNGISPGPKVRLAGDYKAAAPKPSQQPVAERGPDSVLGDFLNGDPPQGARRLRVSGKASAWSYGGKTYLVSDHRAVVTPGFSATAKSGEKQVWRFDQPVFRVLAETADGQQHIIAVE